MPEAAAKTVATPRKLDPALYAIYHDVPVFCEHTSEDGKDKYTREILEAIAENQNSRIRNTGDYTAICLGHTPTAVERYNGVPMPPLIGLAGPFKVGIIGEEEPTWAIIAEDWAIQKDCLEMAKAWPRRSIELRNMKGPPETRWFDPIAVLGADAPHLPLGIMQYSRSGQDDIAHFAAAVATAPGGSNVFVPSASGWRYKHDQAQQETQEPENMAITDEDLSRIVNAIQETEEFSFIHKLMGESNAKGTPTEEEGKPEIPAPEMHDDDSNESKPNEPPMKPKKEEEDTDAFRKHSSPEVAARFSALTQENVTLKAQMAAMEKSVRETRQLAESMQRESALQSRFSHINQLAEVYAIDPAEEFARAGKMTDTEFAGFYGKDSMGTDGIISRFARRPDNGVSLFRLHDATKGPAPDGPPGLVTEQEKTRALAFATEAARNGQSMTFAEGLAKVRGKAG